MGNTNLFWPSSNGACVRRRKHGQTSLMPVGLSHRRSRIVGDAGSGGNVETQTDSRCRLNLAPPPSLSPPLRTRTRMGGLRISPRSEHRPSHVRRRSVPLLPIERHPKPHQWRDGQGGHAVLRQVQPEETRLRLRRLNGEVRRYLFASIRHARYLWSISAPQHGSKFAYYYYYCSTADFRWPVIGTKEKKAGKKKGGSHCKFESFFPGWTRGGVTSPPSMSGEILWSFRFVPKIAQPFLSVRLSIRREKIQKIKQ